MYVFGDRRLLDDGDELVIFVPLDVPIVATVETGFQLAAPAALTLRMRPTDDGWQVVGLVPADEANRV